MECLLKASGISKSYGEMTVFRDLDVEGFAGQSIALVGPSGIGKSTLLSILGLLLAPSSGSIEIKGTLVDEVNEAALARIRRSAIGFVFQYIQLVGSLRAWENVATPARFLEGQARWPEREIEEKSKDLLVSLGLEDRCEYYPHQLSVGQRRRVALARALLLDPPIIIADEPTNDLDEASAQSVTQALFDKVDQGRLLLFATHDEQLSRRADEVVVIEQDPGDPER